MNKKKPFITYVLRFFVIIIIAAMVIFVCIKGTIFYHEWRVVKNLKIMETAMEQYKVREGRYPKVGEIWPTTNEVNRNLDIDIKDTVFNYQCFGWTGWTSFRCNAKSPLYDWWLHFHEGISIHCAQGCPTCADTHDPSGGCYY